MDIASVPDVHLLRDYLGPSSEQMLQLQQQSVVGLLLPFVVGLNSPSVVG